MKLPWDSFVIIANSGRRSRRGPWACTRRWVRWVSLGWWSSSSVCSISRYIIATRRIPRCRPAVGVISTRRRGRRRGSHSVVVVIPARVGVIAIFSRWRRRSPVFTSGRWIVISVASVARRITPIVFPVSRVVTRRRRVFSRRSSVNKRVLTDVGSRIRPAMRTRATVNNYQQVAT